MYDCIELNTYSLKEVVLEANDSNYLDLNISSWEVSFDVLHEGPCYGNKLPIGSIGYSDKPFQLKLNSSLAHHFVIFDPEFHIRTKNPKVFPRILLTLKNNCGYKYLYIEVIQHVKLNEPKNPCEESKDYSFNDCIKSRSIEIMGCRMRWEKSNAFKKMPLCTGGQMWWYSGLHYKYMWMEQTMLVNYTNCPLPCSYKEYKLVDNPIIGKQGGDECSLEIRFASRAVLVEKEEKTYSFESLVAECGGFLGLFLGFSFLTVWDCLIEMMNFVKNWICR